jgi:hypothetical protein
MAEEGKSFFTIGSDHDADGASILSAQDIISGAQG